MEQRFKVLREAGLIRGEIEGPATCYCLNEAGIRWLKEQIEGWLAGCCAASQRIAPAEIELAAIEGDLDSTYTCGRRGQAEVSSAASASSA